MKNATLITASILIALASLQKASAQNASDSLSHDCLTGNPIIFIHGTMGSRLIDRNTQRIAWGKFSHKAANGRTDAAIRGISHPMSYGQPLDRMRDPVASGGTLHDLQVTLFPGLKINADYYCTILDQFAGKDEKGIQTRHARTCCEFDYDWRRSCDESAVKLAAFIEDRKHRIETKRRSAGITEPVRFDIVAHSQGALVARYYLRHGSQPLGTDGELPPITWEGAPNIRNVIMLGAPNAGIARTLEYLTRGHRAHAVLPHYEAAVVGTMPAIYQMLPRARDGVLIDRKAGEFLDPLDFDLWVENKWGLANPRQDRILARLLPGVDDSKARRSIALDHLRKCLHKARRLQAALDRPGSRPREVKVYLCTSTSEKTPARYLAKSRRVHLDLKVPGDGTVATYSAFRCPSPAADSGPGRPAWDGIRLFKANHDGLAAESEVTRHILATLAIR